MSRSPHAPSEAGSETGQAGRPRLQPRFDDAGLAPAAALPEPRRTRTTGADLAVRETGLLFLMLALVALRILYDRVHAGPPHDPIAAELALGVLAFMPASFGAAALWFGEELFR